MKKNRKFAGLICMSIIISTMLVGCEQDSTLPAQRVEPTPNEVVVLPEESIYNQAYENFNHVTDLGVILSAPSQEDLDQLETIDSYVYETGAKDEMLIIPKYNGSKITVSRVEYTGERYIAKDALYTKETTIPGYGLLVKANYPDGIPQIVITITYQNKSCEYVITSDDKSGNASIKYLEVGTEKNKGPEGDLITSIKESTYLQGLNRFSSYEIDIDKDGSSETIEVYSQGKLLANGEYLMDDGQEWALILRKGDEIYPLFERSYIQLGGLEYMAYIDYDNYEQVHIIVTYKSGAALIYYDCTYDEDTNKIVRNEFYEVSNINKLKDWNY